ncbi:MAG: ABC transporter ATP-binding protein [Microbacteriaceae bacterium]
MSERQSPAAPPRAAALDIRDLSVAYGSGRRQVPALESVSFGVAPGEFVALVGESGSGKSTLARTVTGLLPATARTTGGSVHLAGTEVTHVGERRWSRVRGRAVGLIPQDPGASLNPVQTIGTQVAEIFAIRGERLGRTERRARALELLEAAEVSRAKERLDQFPHELSGGLKQRVLIAIAFGLSPELLVADEPTSALDVTVQKQIMRTFDRLAHENGSAVLFVTHDIALAADHASRALVLRGGRLVEDAPVEQLVRTQADPYTRELIEHARTTSPARVRREPDHASALLTVSSLGKVFPGRAGGEPLTAVDDVSFQIEPGQTLALVGESGSGKSTTARMILRLTDPTSGSIQVDGRDATTLRGRARLAHWRAVQMVYQNPDSALDPRWSVGEIVAEPLHAMAHGDRRDRRARVEELLDAVALPAGTIGKRASELSGGQRQRVAIARALAPRSRLVVLDEALSALDVITQEQVLALLARLQAELGVAYLFISHDLAVVRRIADRIVVMRNGRVVESGDAADTFAAPRTDYVRELLAAVPGRRLGEAAPVPPTPTESENPRP